MTLYNCKHSGEQHRISKFDEDMNVISSYLCDIKNCDCPAGVRPTCRHREMLPRFIQRQHVGTEWFYDYDRGGWVQQGEEWAQPQAEALDLPNPMACSGDSNGPLPHEAKLEPSSSFMKRRFL